MPQVILGLPWTTWLLIVVSVVPALLAALAFFRAHGRDDRPARPR